MIFHKSLAVAAAAAAMSLTVQAAQAQNCMEVLSRTPEASDFVAPSSAPARPPCCAAPAPSRSLRRPTTP